MSGRGAPCGVCRVLRRKCAENCLFSPYFSRDQTGADKFRAIRNIFGQSQFNKMLLSLPIDRRHDAVASILYEAQVRIQDPVHGCSSKILALQQELRQQLAASHAQLAALRSVSVASRNIHISAYGNVQQSQVAISDNNNIMFPPDPPYSYLSEMQSIMSETAAVKNYPGEALAAQDGPTSQREYMSILPSRLRAFSK